MRILELTNFSSGIDGVWQRVKQESEMLSNNGHEVRIFSSNFIKGKDELAPAREKIGKFDIMRFPARKLGGESYMKWNFLSEGEKFMPDLIIAHVYRHYHTHLALKLAKKLNCRAFLVTHAPFVSIGSTRKWYEDIIASFYDNIVARITLKKFDKIIAITKWEIPYLKKMGINEDKIAYVPNGISPELFAAKKGNEVNKILFLGRISPIKNLEILISAIPLLTDINVKVEIVGPAENFYLEKLKELVKEKKVENRVIFSKPVIKLKDKIKKIDSAKIFVLPSKREAMPQALIEAMAREKLVIASNNFGTRDIIKDRENGFLFENGNASDLAEKINNALKNFKKISNTKKNARKSVSDYNWEITIKKLENLFHKAQKF